MSEDPDDTGDGEQPSPFVAFAGMPVLSREAFMLHSFAVLDRVKDGRPGFVSDDYLNPISAETTVAAFELEAYGMWSRREGGYFIVADEMVSQMIHYNEEADGLAAACQARGAHRADAEEAGWVICADCGIPLRRPDGGPVATDGGGPLGPDLREGR